MDDPKVKEAIAETEKELNKREMGLMERHKDVLEHGKATLEMKQDLAKQQVKGECNSSLNFSLTGFSSPTIGRLGRLQEAV